MSFNIRDYVSDNHIESISEIATGQARIIQALSLDNSQKDKEIERLNNILDTLMQDMALLNATGKKEIKPKYVFDRIVMLRERVDKE